MAARKVSEPKRGRYAGRRINPEEQKKLTRFRLRLLLPDYIRQSMDKVNSRDPEQRYRAVDHILQYLRICWSGVAKTKNPVAMGRRKAIEREAVPLLKNALVDRMEETRKKASDAMLIMGKLKEAAESVSSMNFGRLSRSLSWTQQPMESVAENKINAQIARIRQGQKAGKQKPAFHKGVEVLFVNIKDQGILGCNHNGLILINRDSIFRLEEHFVKVEKMSPQAAKVQVNKIVGAVKEHELGEFVSHELGEFVSHELGIVMELLHAEKKGFIKEHLKMFHDSKHAKKSGLRWKVSFKEETPYETRKKIILTQLPELKKHLPENQP